MRKEIAIICLVVGVLLIAGCVEKFEEISTPEKELKLSDFPEAFKENTLIVIGDNVSEIEIQAANEIAGYLENRTGNKPLVKKYSEITEKDKRNYNLIIIGTPKSNIILKEIYTIADVLEVNETFPGEGKGVLEILRNPWNKERVLLLVEGSDKWGVLSSALVSEILEYMWKPKKVFITSQLNKLISKQTAINVSLEFLRNMHLTSRSVEDIKLIVYPAHPDFTDYYVFNATSGKEIGFLDRLINITPYVWLVSYKINNNKNVVIVFVDANTGTILGVLKNVKLYRLCPKIM